MENLELLLARTDTRLESVKRHIEGLPDGRGGEWKALLWHVHAEFAADAADIVGDVASADQLAEPARAQLRANAGQRLERLQILLDALHAKMATYRDAVARSDVPVGLQHLVDVLIDQVVIDSGDPIIHLDTRNMYSTIDLVGPMDELVAALGPQGRQYSGRHPIAFNLPALDPNNVLLSPVLAHEVAHTAVTRELLKKLQDRIQSGPAGKQIDDAFARLGFGGDQRQTAALAQAFQSWSAELLCDAIAIALTGPSFLFAFAAFVPPTAVSGASKSHPDIQDRLGFALDVIDSYGWTPFIEERAPKLVAWFREVSTQPVLTGGAEETFLREAISASSAERRQIASDHVVGPLDSKEGDRIDQAAAWLAQGVPLVDVDGSVLSPWQVVLAAWIAGISVRGDESPTVALAAGDRDYNAVIVKAIEYSQIVSEWRSK